ncbi:MAG: hypothetical protein M9938_06285 [Solirubrobacterales bacterium]|nr:hypothetical protein [Solirubrobacterales bacterium]
MSESEKKRIKVELEPDTEVHEQDSTSGDSGLEEATAVHGAESSSDRPESGGESEVQIKGARARAEALAAASPRQPGLEDVRAWDGYRVDEIGGHSVARVEGSFVDAESGEPAWVLVKLGRFGRVVPISIRECAAAAGRVWVPYDREVIREAPAVDPEQPLTGAQEKQVLDYYGIPDTVGRGIEIKDRDPDRVTAKPAA